MKNRTPKGTEGVFGSIARARILGLLAQAATPRTGYEVAKELGLGVSNVYPELKRLEAWALVASRADARGRKCYTLDDEDLRRFLMRRVRVISSADWLSAERVAEREALSVEAQQLAVKAPRTQNKRRNRPPEGEFRRPAEKDRALRRLKDRAGSPP